MYLKNNKPKKMTFTLFCEIVLMCCIFFLFGMVVTFMHHVRLGLSTLDFITTKRNKNFIAKIMLYLTCHTYLNLPISGNHILTDEDLVQFRDLMPNSDTGKPRVCAVD